MFLSLWVYYTFIVSFKTNFQNHNRTSTTNLIINKLHHSINRYDNTTKINLITRKAVKVTFELSPYNKRYPASTGYTKNITPTILLSNLSPSISKLSKWLKFSTFNGHTACMVLLVYLRSSGFNVFICSKLICLVISSESIAFEWHFSDIRFWCAFFKCNNW